MWLFRSPIGKIYIKKLSTHKFGLLFDDTLWDVCNDPHILADNVYMQCTGCTEWDTCNTLGLDVPTDLSQWELTQS